MYLLPLELGNTSPDLIGVKSCKKKPAELRR